MSGCDEWGHPVERKTVLRRRWRMNANETRDKEELSQGLPRPAVSPLDTVQTEHSQIGRIWYLIAGGLRMYQSH